MIDVTQLLTKNKKRIAKFAMLKRIQPLIQSGQAKIETQKGKYGGYSKISENLEQEFLLWVSEATRKIVLNITK